MCHLSPQDQHVCQSHHGIAEAVTGVLGRAQFPSCSFYHPRSSRSRFRPTRKAAICAGNFPDSNGIVMISKGKHVPIRLNQCLPWTSSEFVLGGVAGAAVAPEVYPGLRCNTSMKHRAILVQRMCVIFASWDAMTTCHCGTYAAR